MTRPRSNFDADSDPSPSQLLSFQKANHDHSENWWGKCGKSVRGLSLLFLFLKANALGTVTVMLFIMLIFSHKSTAIARAFAIGRTESDAVSNLMTRVHETVTQALCDVVAIRGMTKFLSHDILARDILNKNFTSGINGLESWKDVLRNEDTCELEP